MRFDIRWTDECVEELALIYDGLENADAATAATEFHLGRDPHGRATWPLVPGSGRRLAWVKPYRHFPAVYLSYSVVDEGNDRYCLVSEARRSNDPRLS
jgi:hypothetical protein